MKTVVLGVSGSVACYRACDLARELMRSGCTVRVCLTDAAQEFIKPALFEALTGQPCLVSTFDEPIAGRMAHIDWARNANLLVIAPATANSLNKLAAGVADDMLTTIALAYEGPLIVAPAMNPSMYSNAATQASLSQLHTKGVFVVEPGEGEVACGEQGQGKLASIAEIHQMVRTVLDASERLKGKSVLITSGPTEEPVDSVRFLTNRSSGKMGAALARAALLMGAHVTVVSGPAKAPLPEKARVIRVQTAQQMLEASLEALPLADFVIGAAAVADFAVANPVQGKIRRTEGVPEIKLVANPDVIQQLAQSRKPGATVVAFAAEPDDGLESARRKLSDKGVQAVVVNNVGDSEIGFGSDNNELVLLTADNESRSPRASKLECALWLFHQLTS